MYTILGHGKALQIWFWLRAHGVGVGAWEIDVVRTATHSWSSFRPGYFVYTTDGEDQLLCMPYYTSLSMHAYTIFADVWLKCCAPLPWIWGVHCNVDIVVWTGYIWNSLDHSATTAGLKNICLVDTLIKRCKINQMLFKRCT